MNVVLVALDDSPAAAAVSRVARRLAERLDLTCRSIHVRQPGRDDRRQHLRLDGIEVMEGDPATVIEREARDPSVVAVVLGSRQDETGPVPAGHVATAVVERARKPVVVVPPSADPSRQLDRVLIPLEGTAETSEPIVDILTQLVEAGVAPVALHVFDGGTVPRFWDDCAHCGQSFATEFESRWWHAPAGPVDVLLQRGDPATTVVEVAQREQADLIVLGWAQDLGPGHARVVRAAMVDTRVPVLLVPIHVDRPAPHRPTTT